MCQPTAHTFFLKLYYATGTMLDILGMKDRARQMQFVTSQNCEPGEGFQSNVHYPPKSTGVPFSTCGLGLHFIHLR